MIDRRNLIAGLTFGAALFTRAQPLSACDLAEREEDRAGEKLVSYLKSGDEKFLNDLFREKCSLVCFEKRFVLGGEQFAFEGSDEVRRAIVGLRTELVSVGTSRVRQITRAALDRTVDAYEANRITVTASLPNSVFTDCGWTSHEQGRRIYYRGGDTDIFALAVMPLVSQESAS